MVLRSLHRSDRSLFERYLGLKHHVLSSFSWPGIALWQALFDVRWEIIDENLCVFFKNSLGCFMYLPPLAAAKGAAASRETIGRCFEIMDSINTDSKVSRIENVEREEIELYGGMGLRSIAKDKEYVYKTDDLIRLSGDAYKAKRSSCNYFERQYAAEYRPFEDSFRDACLELYHRWMQQRKERNQDPVFQQMLDDGLAVCRLGLESPGDMGLTVRVVFVDGNIAAYTMGFALNDTTWCIFAEIADVAIKGASQFIFRRFCEEQRAFSFINAMDDSGLENLKRVKESYRPCRFEEAYIAMRK